MTDRTSFEARLAAAYAAYADRAPVEVDAVALAAAIADTGAGRLARPTLARRGRVLLAVALLALLLAGVAVAGAGSGLAQLPWAVEGSHLEPADVDPCAALYRAVDALGPAPDRGPHHDQDGSVLRMCAWGWDSGYQAPHVLFRPARTATDAAGPLLLHAASLLGGVPSEPTADGSGWLAAGPGRWMRSAVDGVGFAAVAVASEPYFFVVTAPDHESASRLADALLTELRASVPGPG